MPNKFGEYIIPAYTWSDEQTALDKGYTELIRCIDCVKWKTDECSMADKEVLWELDYCSYAVREEE